MNQKVVRVQNYLTKGKDYRRWRLWACCMDDYPYRGAKKESLAKTELEYLRKKGLKAKIWAPLPQHKTSGHIHIVVLATFKDLCDVSGITDYQKFVRVEKERGKAAT